MDRSDLLWKQPARFHPYFLFQVYVCTIQTTQANPWNSFHRTLSKGMWNNVPRLLTYDQMQVCYKERGDTQQPWNGSKSCHNNHSYYMNAVIILVLASLLWQRASCSSNMQPESAEASVWYRMLQYAHSARPLHPRTGQLIPAPGRCKDLHAASGWQPGVSALQRKHWQDQRFTLLWLKPVSGPSLNWSKRCFPLTGALLIL